MENAGETHIYTVTEGGERLDVFLASVSDNTRSYLQKLIDNGSVLVNGIPTKSKTKLRPGDEILVNYPLAVETSLIPQDIPLNIIYEDESIAVIDKPKGMVVHPAPGNEDGTLVNALMYRLKDLSGIGGELRPGIVHRIDKLTSGLIVVAKNDRAHISLAEQFKAHSAYRVYLALVNGNLREDSGTINAPIGRHRLDRKRMAVDSSGREAITHYNVISRFSELTLLRVRLETGRTHQIRVHMAHIKHPVTGDELYSSGKNRFSLEGQALHAMMLTLKHPDTGRIKTFKAPLPDWFYKILKELGVSDPNALYDSIT